MGWRERGDGAVDRIRVRLILTFFFFFPFVCSLEHNEIEEAGTKYLSEALKENASLKTLE